MVANRVPSGPLAHPGTHEIHNKRQLRYRFQTLSKLDPNDRLSITNWLHTMTAAASSDFISIYGPFVPISLTWYRRTFGIPDEDDDDMHAHDFNVWLQTEEELNTHLYSWLLPSINWVDCPELRSAVKGDADGGDPGLCATQDARKLIWMLRQLGAVSARDVQQTLTTEWSTLYAEAHMSSSGRTRGNTVFTNASTSTGVKIQLHKLLENYEDVPAQKAQPQEVWIRTMLNLLREDVPCLESWATNELTNLVLNGPAFPSRKDWIAHTVTPLLLANLPAHKALIAPAAGGLNAAFGGNRQTGPFQPAQRRTGPPNLASRRPGPPSTRNGSCTVCDCRACANAVVGGPVNPIDALKTCSVFANAPAAPGSSDENKSFIECVRNFLKATGNKHRSAPYLKGMSAALYHFGVRSAALVDDLGLTHFVFDSWMPNEGARIKRLTALMALATQSGDLKLAAAVNACIVEYEDDIDGDGTEDEDAAATCFATLNVAAEAAFDAGDMDTETLHYAAQEGRINMIRAGTSVGDRSTEPIREHLFAHPDRLRKP